MHVLIMNFIDSGAGAPTIFVPESSDPLGREKPIVRQAEGRGVGPSRKSRARKKSESRQCPWVPVLRSKMEGERDPKMQT